MKPEPDRIRDLFVAALGASGPSGWDAFLEGECRGDRELLREVRQLLEAHLEAGSLLEVPALAIAGPAGLLPWAEGAARAVGTARPEGPGPGIGPYELVEELGEGGMGVVYRAEQGHPVRRAVALKVIKPGMDTRQVIARFEAERQALALMDHPNIARVLDAGATDGGRPYFVMELVRGIPITEYCDQARLPIRERLELFVQVCQAVQHAHHKEVIHRDLKPSNVLVTRHDGRPVVKVIDFGIAKALGQQLTDKTLFTSDTQPIGTPLYMSPEQVGIGCRDIDTRSDIYALGVLLYELLTGTTPCDQGRLKGAAFDEVRRVIREEESLAPSTRISTLGPAATAVSVLRRSDPERLSRSFRGELDWIAMKCLEKDRERRYETAGALARDIERYLRDEPVQACPPSAAYRLRKFARRNQRRLVIAVVVALAVLLAAGVLGWNVRDRAARQAVLEREISRALEEVEDSYRRDELPAALSAVKRAEGLLAGGEASDALKRRVHRWRDDLHLVATLEEIRLQQTATKDEYLDDASADPAYRAVFRRYGLDPEALHPDETARPIRASRIRDRLVSGLDGWMLSRWAQGRPDWARLLAVCRRADGDPWRERFRDAFQRRDNKALEDLSRDRNVLDQPPTTLLLLGEVLARIGEVPLAVEVLRQAQRRHPGDFWINFRLAHGLRRMKPADRSDAVGFNRVAVALRPENTAAHNYLGLALLDQGRPDEAIAEFRRAIALRPENYDARVNLGNALRAQGEADAAIAEFRRAVALRPDDAGAHVSFGNILSARRRWDEAVAEYRRAVALRPDDSEAHLDLGRALRHRGETDPAIAEFRRAIALRPENYDARVNLGNALRAQGEADAAIAEFRRAVALRPDDAGAHVSFGNILSARRRWDEAVAEYRRAVALRPEDPEVHLILGHALRTRGSLVQALDAYQEFIRLRPDGEVGRNHLGLTYALLGQWDNALAEIQRQRPNDGWFMLACLRLLAGDVAGYQQLGRQLLERDGQTRDPVAAHAISRTCLLSPNGFADPTRAVAWAEQVVASAPDVPRFLHVLGATHYRAGQFDQAARRSRESLEKKPDWDAMGLDWLVLAMSHQRMGHPEEARHWLEKAARWREQVTGVQGGPSSAVVWTPAISPPPQDWLEFQVLYPEARALVQGSGQEKSATGEEGAAGESERSMR